MEAINGALKEREEAVRYLGLEIDVILCYQSFYEQHKQANGSNKRYLGDGESYVRAMQDRYNYCIDNIDCLIEAKHTYNKRTRKTFRERVNDKLVKHGNGYLH